MSRWLIAAVSAVAALVLGPPAAGAASRGIAPGGPGANAIWTPADKEGFGTSTTTASRVWYTLEHGRLTEVYYPNLGTPSIRDLQFVVSDGKTFAEREQDAPSHSVALADPHSLTYTQTVTHPGLYQITKTYVTDPARDALLMRVHFTSLMRGKLALYALLDPSLNNGGMDDSGATSGDALTATDGSVASALVAAPAFTRLSNGYLGTSDGWTDLRGDYRMDWSYSSAPNGNVVQTAATALTGQPGAQDMTVALGFAPGAAVGAEATARAALGAGFAVTSAAYEAGWRGYVSGLAADPASVSGSTLLRTTYDVSTMVLAAHEDKTYRGAFVASPTMPWVWGTGLENPSGAYHLVWARDLYEIATALLAAGDRPAADRALTYLFDRQQKPDGSFPQNSTVDGTPHWGNLQLDEVADPIVLAWMLGRSDAATYANHVAPAARFIAANGPATPQERWENQGGYSPATIAAEISGLVCAADIARRNHDMANANRWDHLADAWQASVDGWTVTTNGPYSSQPYYLRLTKDGNPNAGTAYNIGDSGPDGVDQRRVVDPSFLELVRLGVQPPNHPAVVDTLGVVDDQLGVATPNGTFWHRYNFDGYGEQADGSNWDIGFPAGSQRTIGRIWPIFAGERGEYELAAGRSASARLLAMAQAGNAGYLIPEQVWDDSPPSGSAGFPRGEGTFSATPLAWSHAQFVRLARSIDAGRPVEQPSIVACRYARACAG